MSTVFFLDPVNWFLFLVSSKERCELAHSNESYRMAQMYGKNNRPHLLSLESISSTMSQATRASGEVAPNFLLASRASLMAAEASGRAARVVAARLDEAEGTNAEAAEAPARTIRAESFIIDNGWMELNIIVKVGQRSEYG